jgi:hypothetical protein
MDSSARQVTRVINFRAFLSFFTVYTKNAALMRYELLRPSCRGSRQLDDHAIGPEVFLKQALNADSCRNIALALIDLGCE